eukprot:2158349-Rhodomonas_salina.2
MLVVGGKWVAMVSEAVCPCAGVVSAGVVEPPVHVTTVVLSVGCTVAHPVLETHTHCVSRVAPEKSMSVPRGHAISPPCPGQ